MLREFCFFYICQCDQYLQNYVPAHEEEDEGNDAEDDDDHGQAREHCCSSEMIKYHEDQIQ